MYLSETNHSQIMVNFALFTALLMSFSSYAAQLPSEQYLLENDIGNNISQETFKPHKQQYQSYFDIPDPSLSTAETTQQIKQNYKKVLVLILQKNTQQAITKVNLLIQNHPEQAIYYNLKGLLQLIDNNQNAAEQTFRTAIKLNKNNSQAYTALAQIALQNKDYSKAEKLANEALKVNSYAANAYKILAKIILQEQGIDATETSLLDAQKKMRGNLPAEITILNELVQVYTLKKQPEKLTPLATSLVRRYPGDISALAYLAGVQLLTKDEAAAEKTLRQIIAKQPTNGKFRFLLAKILAQQEGKEQEVLSLLDKAALSVKNPALILSYKAAVLLRQQKFQQAYAIAEKVDQSYPTLSLGKLLKGDIYFTQKKYPQALQNYQLAYEISPTIYNLDAILKILLIQNKRKDALVFLEQELAKNKESALIQLRLATLYQSSQEYELATKQYLALLEIQPDNAVALNNLAWIYSLQNNPQALGLAKKAYGNAPNQGAIADTYGYVLLKNGNVKESLVVLKKAAELHPDIAELQLHLAEAYIANQQLTQANEILQILISKQGKEKSAAIKLLQTL